MRFITGLIAGFLSGVAVSIIGTQAILDAVREIIEQF